jgi:uncharacterized protein (TIGR02001 family)
MLTVARKHRHFVNHIARDSDMKYKLGLRPSVLAAALAALFAGSALAQTPPATPAAPAAMPAAAPAAAPAAEPAKPEPDWTFASNVGIFSQYVFRGISQTDEKPAVQGGFDLSHKSGFYVGTWLSNISWITDGAPDASASLEWDMYGGYKFDLPADFAGDVGVLYYYYPGSYPSNFTKPNTTELYAALNWKFLQAKYSYSVGNTFGFPDSKGSYYIEGNLNYDIVDKVNDYIGKVTLIGHVGYQDYQNNSNYSYTDYKGGVAFDLMGVTVGLLGTGTNAKSELYTNRFGTNISGGQFVGYIQKTF